MTGLDYAILLGFMFWLLMIGFIFSLKVKNSADMFSAGGQSPWWISGLSGFMTIFSAGTFVVWGGIAYQDGLVVVSLLMVTGFSAILVGFNVAQRWRAMGIRTPIEYHRIRFGESIVQLYTWVGFVFRGLGLAVALYSLSTMLCALVPMPDGSFLQDPATGNLSVSWSIVLWGIVVVAYTMSGGLWAVMMTDVIQCIILCLMVLVAVPLSLSAVGGVDAFLEKVPERFFSPVSNEFTYSFLFLWFWLGFFRYAADWAFVQRFICVPTPRDAKKTALLMGGLYVVSPILWMLPAMTYQILEPGTSKEVAKNAYVLMCQEILPAGMLGIMMAAMFSATASMVSSVLNVFAGVFACDFYKPLFNPEASEKRLMWVGRFATVFYGVIIITLALFVEPLGGAKDVVMPLVTAFMGPMFLPVIWGLYSKHMSQFVIWVNFSICVCATTIIRLPPKVAWMQELLSSRGIADFYGWTKENTRLTDALLGLVLPLFVLIVMEMISRKNGVDIGWKRMQKAFDSFEAQPAVQAKSRLPALIVAATLGMLGLTMVMVSIFANKQQTTLAIFSAMLLTASGGIFWFSSLKNKQLKD